MATRHEIVGEAMRTGYTEVLTAAGWRSLQGWAPYGKMEGHATSFRIKDGMIHEARHQELTSARHPAFVMGLWELRQS